MKLTALIRDLLETATPLFTTVSEEEFHKGPSIHVGEPSSAPGFSYACAELQA